MGEMEKKGNRGITGGIHKTIVLKLDFDNMTYETLKDIISNRRFVFKMFGLIPHECVVAKTQHGWHVYLECGVKMELDNRDICVIQILLGDDFKRGCYNWMRAREDPPYAWNVLFTAHETVDTEKSRDLLCYLQRLIIASEES